VTRKDNDENTSMTLKIIGIIISSIMATGAFFGTLLSILADRDERLYNHIKESEKRISTLEARDNKR
jgi:hypothetical protein